MANPIIQLSDELKDLVDPEKLAKLPEPIRNIFTTLSRSQAEALHVVFLDHRPRITEPPLPLPNDIKGLVDPARLAKLPEPFRSEIPKMTRFQAKQLRGSFADHSDFLELPLELREAIYELLLCSDNAPAIVRYGTPSAEATSLIHRYRTAKLHITAKRSGQDVNPGCYLKPVDVKPFFGFRTIHVVIQSHEHHHLVEYGQKKKASLGFMLRSWVDILVERFGQYSAQVKENISLEFKLGGCHSNKDWKASWVSRNQPDD